MLVSVLTPTYNRRAWFPLAIHCFLAQTYRGPVEWVVLDDSEPGQDVADLVRDVRGVRYERRTEGRMTIGAKRAELVRLARGQILAFWDDDDYYWPDRLAVGVRTLLGPGKPLIVGTSVWPMYDVTSDRTVMVGPFGPNHATAATWMFRREILLVPGAGEFDPTATKAEEAGFLANWTVPLMQLDPFSCILVISHAGNTCSKARFLGPDAPSAGRLRDLLRKDKAALAIIGRASSSPAVKIDSA
jgi:hypothetical protein